MQIGYLVSITFDEFQVWFRAGELELTPERITPVPIGDDGQPEPDPLRIEEILGRLPTIDLADEQGIVLARLSKALFTERGRFERHRDRLLEHHARVLPIEYARQFYPLTERGGRILASRLGDYSVTLAPAIFEQAWNGLREGRLRESALRGGSALIDLMIADGIQGPSEELLARAREALTVHRSSGRFPLPDRGLLVNAFCYERHDPFPAADIGFLFDLRAILEGLETLRDTGEWESAMSELGNICKENIESQARIGTWILDQRLMSALTRIEKRLSPELTLPGILLFLKWKSRGLKAGAPDFEGMHEDLSACARFMARRVAGDAVWMSGYYFGFENLCTEYYRRKGSRYAFIEERVDFEPVHFPDLDVPEAIDSAGKGRPKKRSVAGGGRKSSRKSKKEDKTRDVSATQALPGFGPGGDVGEGNGEAGVGEKTADAEPDEGRTSAAATAGDLIPGNRKADRRADGGPEPRGKSDQDPDPAVEP